MKKYCYTICGLIAFLLLSWSCVNIRKIYIVNKINFDNENIKGNSNENIVNHAFVSKQGEWIYYHDKNKLYVYNEENDYKIRLSRKSGTCINIVGDLLFFNRSTGFGGFDSTVLQCLNIRNNKLSTINDVATHNFIAYDGWIYYINSKSKPVDCLYKAKYDGTAITKLTDFSVNAFSVIDNKIYITSNNIMILNLDGSILRSVEFNESLNTLSKTNIIFNGNDMYFITGYQKNYGIAKINLDSLQYTQLTDEHCSCFNLQDGWIYYVKENNLKLYKIKSDGTHDQQIGNVKVERIGINIIDEWIYYYGQENKLYRIRTDGTICERL